MTLAADCWSAAHSDPRPQLQGRSKRSGWSGHGRTNNRAGKFYFIYFIFLLYFLAGIIIEPGFFSILFLKQRRHSRQNVHSDDFHPSHAGSHHHSMGGRGPQVHEFVGLYSDTQCDAGTITAVVTICVLQIEPTSEQVSQTVLQVSHTVLQVSQTVLRWSWQHEWTENVRVLLSAYRS